MVNNYDDLEWVTKAEPENIAPLGVDYEKDVNTWITGWESTAATQKGFNMRVGCVDDPIWTAAGVTLAERPPPAFCETNADCEAGGKFPDFAGGCCNKWEAISFNADSTWGSFSKVWAYSTAKELKAGSSWNACMNKVYVDAHMKANPDGLTDNLADLTLIT